MKKLVLTSILVLIVCSLHATTRRYRLMFNTNPSTEISIGWEQQSGINPVVYYGTVDQGTNYTAYPNSQGPNRQVTYFGMDNRFAKLTGLTPNTIYYFVIQDSQGTSQRYWFKTCPNVNTETLSFISGGDSRSGTTQRINSNKMVAKLRPHAVLFGGDLTNTPDNASVQEWLDNWQQATTSDGQMIPLVHSYGNHEQYGSGGASFMYDLFDTPFDVYYNVKFGGDLFSMYTLNGEVLPGHTIPNNTVRVAQKNWLQSSLIADNSIWKGAQYHRPIAPHEAAKGEGADEFNDWANLFYDYGVRLVMESDAHVVKMTQEVKPAMATASGSVNTWFTTSGIAPNKGITFIGEGSWGTIRTMDDGKPWTLAGGSFYQFSWILIDACKIEIRTIDTQNPNAIPEHVSGDYTSISAALEGQIWKPTALPSGVRTILRCNPPVTNFVANQTTVLTNTTVNFTDLSTNSPSSWSWNFGDGGNSTSQNPSHTYTVPGTYTVTLTATNAEGSDSEVKTAYITVYAPAAPVADFVASNVNPSVGQSITFTDLSTNIPTSWSWDFGDGNVSSVQNPTHSYTNPGTYTVTLIATNAYGFDDEIKVGYIVITTGGTVNVTVSNGNDDAEQFRNDGSMYLTSSDLEIGNDTGTDQYMGVRFQNIAIPQGAIITNAYIQFRGDEADAFSSQLNIYIAGEATDNSSTFNTTTNNISSRPLTTSQYTWADGSVPGWAVGVLYNTPNISAVVQEIINRPGWAAGNAMSYIFWSDLGESSERVADSYEGGFPPRLIIDYVLPSPPIANFSSSQNSACIGTSINFTDLSTGGNANQWLWNFGDGSTSTLENPSHTYATSGNFNVFLTASNAGGTNTITQSNLISINANPVITFNGPTEICAGQSATIEALGGTSYLWDSGLGSGAIKTVSPTVTTSYTVTVTDGNGCSESEGYSLTVNALPTIIASADAAICQGSSATISASGATSYTWNNGAESAASASVSPATTTTYTVTGTTNGCTNTDQVIVTVNALPTVIASSDAAICQGISATISASGATSYTWNNGAGSAASASVSPASTTTYTVTGTTNGCTNTDQVIVTVNALPTVVASSDATICQGTSATISASGATSYTWNNGAGSAASASVSPATTTTYTVTGATNGCTNTDQVVVTVNALPTVVASADAAICQGSSATISASGASSYTWNNGAGSAVSASVSPASTTTYTVTGTTNGCTNTDQVIVTVNALPTVVASIDAAICQGTSTTISASGATSYTWNNGAGSAVTASVSPATTTTYTVTGTSNGCTNTDQVIVTVNALPAVVASSDAAICQGAYATISAFGATSYTWNNGAGSAATASVSPATTTTYTVTGTSNGCTNTDQVIVTVNALPAVVASSDAAICQGASATISAFGATSYTWNNGAGSAATASVSPTTTTTYTVTGTSNGCTNTDQVVVTVNALPTVVASADAAICQGSFATISASGATSYTWNNGAASAASASVSPATTTTYTVSGTTNGCTNTDQVSCYC
jgi:PKD repeat protein